MIGKMHNMLDDMEKRIGDIEHRFPDLGQSGKVASQIGGFVREAPLSSQGVLTNNNTPIALHRTAGSPKIYAELVNMYRRSDVGKYKCSETTL